MYCFFILLCLFSGYDPFLLEWYLSGFLFVVSHFVPLTTHHPQGSIKSDPTYCTVRAAAWGYERYNAVLPPQLMCCRLVRIHAIKAVSRFWLLIQDHQSIYFPSAGVVLVTKPFMSLKVFFHPPLNPVRKCSCRIQKKTQRQRSEEQLSFY